MNTYTKMVGALSAYWAASWGAWVSQVLTIEHFT
jgi:hypothetical protein